jgi:hypothetical protein
LAVPELQRFQDSTKRVIDALFGFALAAAWIDAIFDRSFLHERHAIDAGFEVLRNDVGECDEASVRSESNRMACLYVSGD